jgi:PAS domain S-box-containing protein
VDHLLALALEATSDGIWDWHLPSGDAFFSPRYYAMLGYGPEELPPTYESWASLVHPDDLERTERAIQRRIDNGDDSYEVEFRLRTKDGSWLWILGRGKVVERDADGRPVRLVGSHVNIDKRKRAERSLARYRDHLEEMVRERTHELEQTSSLLEATFDAIPDVLGVQDNRHRIIRYNAAGYRFLDMTHDEVEGMRCFELIGRTRECEQCATSEAYRTKQPAAVTRYEDALGTWLDIRAYPILDDDGNLVRVIEHLRDITPERRAEDENRELQERLQHAQKMESLGTLAGGIAHDFNNLLMGIQGRASLLSSSIADPQTSREHVDAIERYVRSASDLTRQLLGFARRGKYEVNPTDVNELVATTSTMFGRTRKGIHVSVHPHPEALVVMADRGQLERVLLNMYINSWQAMPDGGELSIGTDATSIDPSQARLHQIAPGRYCRVTIADTGVGMDEITCQRVFDPFFTTKDKGRGTGLGLASAYGIVTNHGGTITVESTPGEGSSFLILLPLSEDMARFDEELEPDSIGGHETILVIDDEEMILEVEGAMLTQLGYDVYTACGGEEALEFIEATDRSIDLVVLDLIMPGMNGGQVFDSLTDVLPDVPIVLSSGYALDGEAESLIERGCRAFLQKPFSIADLSTTVREVLDQR